MGPGASRQSLKGKESRKLFCCLLSSCANTGNLCHCKAQMKGVPVHLRSQEEVLQPLLAFQGLERCVSSPERRFLWTLLLAVVPALGVPQPLPSMSRTPPTLLPGGQCSVIIPEATLFLPGEFSIPGSVSPSDLALHAL